MCVCVCVIRCLLHVACSVERAVWCVLCVVCCACVLCLCFCFSLWVIRFMGHFVPLSIHGPWTHFHHLAPCPQRLGPTCAAPEPVDSKLLGFNFWWRELRGVTLRGSGCVPDLRLKQKTKEKKTLLFLIAGYMGMAQN